MNGLLLKIHFFFHREIHLLSERWGKVVISGGKYFDWNTVYCFFLIHAFRAKKTLKLIETPNTCRFDHVSVAVGYPSTDFKIRKRINSKNVGIMYESSLLFRFHNFTLF